MSSVGVRAAAAWAVWWWACAAAAEPPLPPQALAALRGSGLPLSSFGLYIRPVNGAAPADAIAALNAEQPFRLASTAKLVTSLAALNVLGLTHRWDGQAYATAPVAKGSRAGDLVIVGGAGSMAPAELRQWFRQMHTEGLTQVSGRIVLQGLTLPPESRALGLRANEGDRAPAPLAGRALVVNVRPGRGAQAAVELRPRVEGVTLSSDVAMGGSCAVYARWQEGRAGRAATLLVSGQWGRDCGARDVATLRMPVQASARAEPGAAPPLPLTEQVAALWAESGGRLRGRVIEAARVGSAPRASAPWASRASLSLPELIREMNKTSDNVAARSLLQSLASDVSLPRGAAQTTALVRLQQWLRSEGLADDDIHLDVGSGQSPQERGKPRALVQLLSNAWHASHGKVFVDSLPIAGLDGTLAGRMRRGAATGHAYLKTGTLSDARALAGYVTARSGTVYAVAAIVNHPQAARATPALDALIEWLAREG